MNNILNKRNDELDKLTLYEIIINEEHFFLESHQNRIKFYSSILSAIIIATIAGVINSKEEWHLLFLLIGPLIVLFVASIAKDGTFRMYQRFLESITMRAKIEHDLNLTEKRNDNEELGWYIKESIVPPRHQTGRSKFNSTEEFINYHKNKGYHNSTRKLFRSFQFISALLLLVITIAYIIQIT